MSILAGSGLFWRVFFSNPRECMGLKIVQNKFKKFCGWRSEKVFSGFGSKILISSKA